MTTILLTAIAVLAIACALFFIFWRTERTAAARNLEAWRAANDSAERYAAKFREVDVREAAFRHGLGYYADKSTWVARAPGKHSEAAKDRGKRARKALETQA